MTLPLKKLRLSTAPPRALARVTRYAKLVTFLFILSLLGLGSLIVSGNTPKLFAQTVTSFCGQGLIPVGALAGQPEPMWCRTLTSGPSTFVSGTNSWLDEFEHNLSFATMGSGYKTFEDLGFINTSVHWRHNNHWMTDIGPYVPGNPRDWTFTGRSMMRPDRTFKFENGKLVIEADVAAGNQAYNAADAWEEITITTAAAPGKGPDETYAYGNFGGHESVGCRLSAGRGFTCAYYPVQISSATSSCSAANGSREWEISMHQQCGTTHWGDGPFASHVDPATGISLDKAWRVCNATDADLNCRDRFRLELTKTGLVAYVNGVKYFEETGWPVSKQLSDNLINGNVYVYFSDVVHSGGDIEAVRFHWDRLAVNPSTGPTSAIGEDHNHGTTPTVVSTIKPTATPTPSGSTTGHGLKAEYYNNKDLTGTVITRIDPQVNFNWWWGSPDSAIQSDTFSARWTGFVTVPTTGLYTFHFSSDDGARLWVNNTQIMNRWFDHAPREYRGSIQLEAGKLYPIKLEYYENRGRAMAELRWSSSSITKQIIPSSVLTDSL